MMLVASAILLVGAVAGIWLAVYAYGRQGLGRQKGTVIVVHTSDGRSIRGVLVGCYADVLALGHAVYLLERGEEPLAGEVLIPRQQVSFVQSGAGAGAGP